MMIHRGKVLLLFSAISFLAVIVIVGYGVHKNERDSANLHSGWLAYADYQVGFLFLYPPNYKTRLQLTTGHSGDVSIYDSDPNNWLLLVSYVPQKFLRADTMFNEFLTLLTTENKGVPGIVNYVTSTSSIDNHPAKVITSISDRGGGEMYFFENNNYSFRITTTFGPSSSTTGAITKALSKQILATFRNLP